MKISARAAAMADTVALLAFLVLGVRSHWGGVPLWVFLRNAVPVGVAWAFAATFFGTYRRPGLRTLVPVWLTAVPIGLLVRTWLVGSPEGARVGIFLAVGMAFTALFLLAGRLVATFLARRGAPEDPAVVR